MTYCAATGCGSDTTYQRISMFKFPKNIEMKKRWIEQIRRCRKGFVPTNFSRVCQKHFEDNQFIIGPKFARQIGYNGNFRLRLKPDGVPTLFDIPVRSEVIPKDGPSVCRKEVHSENLTSASSVDNEQTSCRNPYHDRWGNNDSNYRWPSQVPAVAQSVFRLLGYERAPGTRSKFCETCITRATCLTDEEVTEIKKQTKLSRRQSENAVIQIQLKKLEKMNISEEEKAHQAKQLRMLAFVNPGKFMEDFDPEKSTREMKKVNRRIHKEKMARKNQIYDETGCLVSNQKDLCDCLVVECPGCHFPCPKCQSQKCGSDCRNNRRWIYEYIEVEGTGVIRSWSHSDMK